MTSPSLRTLLVLALAVPVQALVLTPQGVAEAAPTASPAKKSTPAGTPAKADSAKGAAKALGSTQMTLQGGVPVFRKLGAATIPNALAPLAGSAQLQAQAHVVDPSKVDSHATTSGAAPLSGEVQVSPKKAVNGPVSLQGTNVDFVAKSFGSVRKAGIVVRPNGGVAVSMLSSAVKGGDVVVKCKGDWPAKIRLWASRTWQSGGYHGFLVAELSRSGEELQFIVEAPDDDDALFSLLMSSTQVDDSWSLESCTVRRL